MKLYQIEHINEDHNKNRVMGMELKFTHSVDSCNGRLWKAEKQPDDWDHVKRLTHMLFLAWNDKNPIEGVVYLGELVGEKSEKEKFCEFFEKFNGFPISKTQKDFFDWYKKDCKMISMGRRTGCSTFLRTLAAWESSKGKKVIYCTDSQNFTRDQYFEFRSKGINIDYYYSFSKGVNPLFNRTFDVGIYDCFKPVWNEQWSYLNDYFPESFALRTYEY